MTKCIIKCLWFVLFLFLSLNSWVSAEEIGDCLVSAESSMDSAGEHFNVYDKSGSYVGYVSLLTEPSGRWSIWKEGEGAENELFENKESAVLAVCPTTP